MWPQSYNPLHNTFLSTIVAALPIVVLLGSIALLRIRIHLSALLGLGVALVIAVGVYRMPLTAAGGAVLYGAAYGLFPIGWIVLNLIFLYSLTERAGLFAVLRDSLAAVTPDRRLQLLLVAFAFGAFFEGAAGFGTPVAITAAILTGLGFRPLQACGLSLIANTAPVAYGALGTPIIALSAVTGLDVLQLSAMVGRQLPFFSLLVPFWLVWAYAGWRGAVAVWPAALTAGAAFAVPQALIANLHGPWLVDVVAATCSMATLAVFYRHWKPADIAPPGAVSVTAEPDTRRRTVLAWMPWLLLSIVVFAWGLPDIRAFLDALSAPSIAVAGLHEVVVRTYPVVPIPQMGELPVPEPALYRFNWLSATGTGILVAALMAAVLLRISPRHCAQTYWRTFRRVRLSLLTIAAMLALGYLTRYSGTDATLGLALAGTGALYPFFGTLLGWLGVALTGSDTASNVLFGGLQKITAEQTGVSPVLMAAANSSGGVMGKMIDAQSIVVASTATGWFGHEDAILRYVFFHSVALAALVGVLVQAQAMWWPFTLLVPK
ncbi:MAG: L-lactate permease [Gammaproteobacteria bacterium]|nr:L-lactate permease [Gammaproteobacteria bacterium]